ncbi:MAG: hypothetical protein R6U32_01290 [Candidatus Woesearchaeota archaeon]
MEMQEEGSDNGTVGENGLTQTIKGESEQASNQEKDEKSNYAPSFSPYEKDKNEILERKFQSEEAREAVSESVPDDEKFKELNKDDLEEQRAQDDVKIAENIENKYKEIEDEMDKVFTKGNTKEFYRPLEKAILSVCREVSEKLGKRYEKIFDERAKNRAKDRKVTLLEEKCKQYEKRVKDAKATEVSYKNELNNLEHTLMNQKFELGIYDLAVQKTEKKLEEMDEEESRYIGEGKKAEAENIYTRRMKVAEDLEKMYEMRDSIAQDVQTNAGIYARRKARYSGTNWSRTEHQVTLSAYKSHLKNLRSVVEDRKKGATAKGVAEGRKEMSGLREEDGKLKDVDRKSIEIANEQLKNERHLKGLDTDYVNETLQQLEERKQKRSNETVQEAYKSLDKIFSKPDYKSA